MKTILTAALFAFLQASASAQVQQALYSVSNALDAKQSRRELWSKEIIKGGISELTKEPFDKKGSAFEKRFVTYWFTEVYQAGQTTYFKEVLTHDPGEMGNGQTGYGYIEERDIKTDRVVNSFPVFYAIAGMNTWMRATFKTYLPDGIEEVVTRDFNRNLYHFPFEENRIVSHRGVVVSHLIYKKEK